jgi:hypothetical protein
MTVKPAPSAGPSVQQLLTRNPAERSTASTWCHQPTIFTRAALDAAATPFFSSLLDVI